MTPNSMKLNSNPEVGLSVLELVLNSEKVPKIDDSEVPSDLSGFLYADFYKDKHRTIFS